MSDADAHEREEALDRLTLLVVSGLSDAQIREAATSKLGLTEDQAREAIDAARQRVTLAASFDRTEKLGEAVTRLNDIFRRALAGQDAKTAMAAQRELIRLYQLHEQPRAVTTDGRAAEIAEARAHLDPLNLADADTPLAELCRLAALRMIELESRRP